MDPITALGAVSSAVGIASFALDLSVGLFKLANQIRSAKDSLKGVGENVKSIAYALEEVEKLLREEDQHVRQGRDLQIFSTRALARVKETTDQCLIVLWKIQAVALGLEEPDEVSLAARLATRASVSAQQAIKLDPRFTAPKPTVWNRLVFAVRASEKLGEYSKQLQNFQISLVLILNVVTVAHLLAKSHPTDDDRKAIDAANKELHRSRPNYRQAAQAVLDGVQPPDVKVGRLSVQTSKPDVQGSLSNFAVLTPPGPMKPRMEHSFRPRLFPAPTSEDIASRDMGSTRNNGPDRGILDGTPPAASQCPRPGSLSSPSSGIVEGISPYTPTSRATYAQGLKTQVARVSRECSPNPLKVYSLQKHGDWRQEKLSRADILNRLAKLDLDPLGVLDKKLKLPLKHQTLIDAIQTKLNGEGPTQEDYEWNLRQLELKSKLLTGLRFGRSLGLLTIIVYLEREAQVLQMDRNKRIASRVSDMSRVRIPPPTLEPSPDAIGGSGAIVRSMSVLRGREMEEASMRAQRLQEMGTLRRKPMDMGNVPPGAFERAATQNPPGGQHHLPVTAPKEPPQVLSSIHPTNKSDIKDSDSSESWESIRSSNKVFSGFQLHSATAAPNIVEDTNGPMDVAQSLPAEENPNEIPTGQFSSSCYNHAVFLSSLVPEDMRGPHKVRLGMRSWLLEKLRWTEYSPLRHRRSSIAKGPETPLFPSEEDPGTSYAMNMGEPSVSSENAALVTIGRGRSDPPLDGPESELDDDLIEQLTLLLTPVRSGL